MAASSSKTISLAQNVSLQDDPFVQEHQRKFIPYFQGKKLVVDLGCGRGRFLQILSESRVPSLGVEMNKQLVQICKKQGFKVHQSDILTFLKKRRRQSVDGFFMSHLIEHFQPQDALKAFQGMSKALKPGGVIVMVTPNSRCLGVISEAFWEDPTHIRPYPANLLSLFAQQTGLNVISKGETDMDRSKNALKNLARRMARVLYRGFRRILLGNFFRPYDLFMVFKKP